LFEKLSVIFLPVACWKAFPYSKPKPIIDYNRILIIVQLNGIIDSMMALPIRRQNLRYTILHLHNLVSNNINYTLTEAGYSTKFNYFAVKLGFWKPPSIYSEQNKLIICTYIAIDFTHTVTHTVTHMHAHRD